MAIVALVVGALEIFGDPDDGGLFAITIFSAESPSELVRLEFV